jgi:hypothetical protein
MKSKYETCPIPSIPTKQSYALGLNNHHCHDATDFTIVCTAGHITGVIDNLMK